MTAPREDYYVGTDRQARTRTVREVQGIPHAMLIDPGGIVPSEGQPTYLETETIESSMAKCAK